jgi:hypothetical protein
LLLSKVLSVVLVPLPHKYHMFIGTTPLHMSIGKDRY